MMAAQWEKAPGRRRTVGADKAYDAGDFVGLMRELQTTPHVTQNTARPAAAPSMRGPRATTATRRVNTRGPASNRRSGG